MICSKAENTGKRNGRKKEAKDRKTRGVRTWTKKKKSTAGGAVRAGCAEGARVKDGKTVNFTGGCLPPANLGRPNKRKEGAQDQCQEGQRQVHFSSRQKTDRK